MVPSLIDWPFPHGKLPKQWQQPHNPPQDLETVDQVTDRCFLTDINTRFERSHIILQAQLDWFRLNCIENYCEALMHPKYFNMLKTRISLCTVCLGFISVFTGLSSSYISSKFHSRRQRRLCS
ncbi:hypothetical protein F4679DRAFT_192058 [Xylaria curta]|nr:hypothetical protein F4679DRAFT_192058 [Xylaria curta]